MRRKTLQQFDQLLVDLCDAFPGEPTDLRPALVLGPSGIFGGDLPFTFVAPLTTKRRGLSLHVVVEPDAVNGLRATSYVQCKLLRSVSTRRLTRHLGPDAAAQTLSMISRSVSMALTSLPPTGFTDNTVTPASL
jgi:mRNA-degrading endonuclease toxin of MazEF toxin-antitoxin module